MTSSDESWQRADRLFEQALDLPEAERAAFLARECADDPELKRRVERLLHFAASHTAEPLPGITAAGLDLAADGDPDDSADAARIGTTIGNFRVVEQLGRGGMAVVFLAERADGEFDQRVALKLIRRGIDSDDTLRRFTEERQILARISHPNIGRLLDGGRTDDGLPYFVMERIEGLPIDRHCEERSLDTRERLDLFLQTADAVAHAHGNLVVHGDIKSSNILVTAEGAVKLLDFGIARHLEGDGGGAPAEDGARFLTPTWASPEQMRGEPVTTSSDVYQLGLLLERLLDGRRGGADLAAIGRRARAEDPAERYGSVAQLADDVRRFLAGLPVSAVPDALGYRLRRLVGRYPVATGFAALALVTIVVFAVTTFLQGRRIANERDRANLEAAAAESVSDFLTGLFKVSDPGEARGNDIRARELLDRGAEEIEGTLADEPRLGARLMITMGQVYQQLGLRAQAEPLLARALEVRGETLGPDHPDTLAAAGALAAVVFKQGRYDEAEQRCLDTLKRQRRVVGREDPEALRTANVLANVYNRQGRYDEAETLYHEVLEARRRTLGPDHRETTSSVFNLGALYWTQGRYDDAEPLFLETVAIRRRTLGDDHPDTLNSLNNLGNLYQRQGQLDAAESVYRETLETRRRVLGQEHPATMTSMYNLAALYQKQGQLEQSEILYRETLEARRDALGEDHVKTLRTMNGLADLLTARERHDEAAELFSKALEGQLRVFGDQHHEPAVTMHNLACVRRDMGRYDEGHGLFERSRAIIEATLGKDHPFVAASVAEHAALFRARGDEQAALALEQRYSAGDKTAGQTAP